MKTFETMVVNWIPAAYANNIVMVFPQVLPLWDNGFPANLLPGQNTPSHYGRYGIQIMFLEKIFKRVQQPFDVAH